MKKKNRSNSKPIGLALARYFFLLVIALVMAYSDVFYRFFLILTIYPVDFLLDFFYESFVYQGYILVESTSISLIQACIAVSAYFLLLILNFTTPMPPKQRMKTLIFSFASLLLLNILRIFTLSIMFVEDFVYFEVVHKIFWYTLSIAMVLVAWFASVKLFGVKNIPVYTDFKNILNSIKVY